MRSLNFFLFAYSFQPHYVSEVSSVSDRNKYQESSWGKRQQERKADNLTISPPSVSRLPTKYWSSTSHNLTGLQGLLQGELSVFYFTFTKLHQIEFETRTFISENRRNGQVQFIRRDILTSSQRRTRCSDVEGDF
jgi:hypothetical protein